MKIAFMLVVTFVLAQCQHPYFNFYYQPQLPSSFRHLRYPLLPLPAFSYEPRDGSWFLNQGQPDDNMAGLTVESNEQAASRTIPGQQGDDLSPRFFFNDFSTAAVIQRPGIGFNRRTIFYTSTGTQTVYTTINCFTSTLFNANAGTCPNRRRDIEAQLKELIKAKGEMPSQFEASPVQKVETTAVPIAEVTQFNQPKTVISSKFEEDGDTDKSEIGLDRAKRFFGGVIATTVTTWSFTTSTIPNRIGGVIQQGPGVGANNIPAICPIGGANGCLFGCIPIGYTTC